MFFFMTQNSGSRSGRASVKALPLVHAETEDITYCVMVVP